MKFSEALRIRIKELCGEYDLNPSTLRDVYKRQGRGRAAAAYRPGAVRQSLYYDRLFPAGSVEPDDSGLGERREDALLRPQPVAGSGRM